MSAEKNKPSPYRVLSLDGGGMRGIITAVWLAALEERLEQPLRNHFDLICGTSTGSFLACGIASGQDAHALIKLYHSQGNLVFPAGLIRFVKLWGHLFGQSRTAHKFRQQGLRRVLQSVFTDRTLKQLQPPVLITCHDDAKDESLILTSLEIAQQKLPIWEVCMASSALPILFPPYPIKLPDRGKVYLSDGGVDNPDPAPSAIRYLADHEQVLKLSLKR